MDLNWGVCPGVALSFLASRLTDTGVLKLPISSGCWPEHGHATPCRLLIFSLVGTPGLDSKRSEVGGGGGLQQRHTQHHTTKSW